VCRGRNHGRGLLAEVISTSIPQLKSIHCQYARDIAEEWRRAVALAMEAIEPLGKEEYERKLNGELLSLKEYERCLRYIEAKKAVKAASALQTHKARMKALRRILTKFS
jgi:CRISPR/Cas system-associated endonuclease Cas1